MEKSKGGQKVCSYNSYEKLNRVFERLSIGILLLGALLRIAQFAFNRSLWLDEGFLAENISSLGVCELFGPLLNGQSAPVGFLLLEKTLCSLLGYSDWCLRIVPLLAGLGTLYLFYLLARETLEPEFMVMACALLSFADVTIYYSSELKPYSCDVFFVVLNILLAYLLLTRFSTRVLCLMAVSGAVSIWISLPSVFVLAGIWLTLLWKRADKQHVVLISASWGTSAVLVYLLSLRHQNNTAGLQEFWSFAFMPLPPFEAHQFGWFWRSAKQFFINPMMMTVPEIAMVLTLLGLCTLFLRNRLLLALCVVPAMMALLASAMHIYPFSGRLVLFLVPLAILVVVSGLQFVARWSRISAWLVFLVVIFVPAQQSLFHLVVPRTHEHMKPLFGSLESLWEPGDVLVIDRTASPSFRAYEYLHGFESSDYEVKGYEQLLQLQRTSRIWFLTSHRREREIGTVRRFFSDTRTIIHERLAEHSYAKMEGDSAIFLLSPPQAEAGIRFIPGIGEWQGMRPRDQWSSPIVELRDLNLPLQQYERFLIVELNGKHPFRRDIKKLGLRCFFNTIELDFVTRHGNRYVYSLPKHQELPLLKSIRLEAQPFVPKEIGIGEDSRSLGLDLRTLEITPIGFFFFPPEKLNARILGDPQIRGDITFMWSRKRSALFLKPGQKGVFFVKAGHPDIAENPVVVEVFDDGIHVDTVDIRDRGWKKVEFQLEEKTTRRVMTFVVSRTWNPKKEGVSKDSRDLGIGIVVAPG